MYGEKAEGIGPTLLLYGFGVVRGGGKSGLGGGTSLSHKFVSRGRIDSEKRLSFKYLKCHIMLIVP